jgi:hypothetical protein
VVWPMGMTDQDPPIGARPLAFNPPYFGYARQGRSALWVHVPDEADATRAIRALANH